MCRANFSATRRLPLHARATARSPTGVQQYVAHAQSGRNDPICEIVARKVIEIGATGITDDVAISAIAFQQLGRA